MSGGWMMYWWVVFVAVFAALQTQARRRREMGPRVFVEPAEFLRIVAENSGLVIEVNRGKKFGIQAQITYVSRCGDYYYYTSSRKPLSLPAECEVQQARSVLL